jgi:hypothetical protein
VGAACREALGEAAGISGRTEFIASFEHRFVCFRAPTGTEGEDEDGTAIHWSRGVIQRRPKSSAPLAPVAVRSAGLGEELILQTDEVTEDDRAVRPRRARPPACRGAAHLRAPSAPTGTSTGTGDDTAESS